MPYTCKCLNCNKEFVNERPRKFCSLECFFNYRQKITIQRKNAYLKMLEKTIEEVKHG